MKAWKTAMLTAMMVGGSLFAQTDAVPLTDLTLVEEIEASIQEHNEETCPICLGEVTTDEAEALMAENSAAYGGHYGGHYGHGHYGHGHHGHYGHGHYGHGHYGHGHYGHGHHGHYGHGHYGHHHFGSTESAGGELPAPQIELEN